MIILEPVLKKLFGPVTGEPPNKGRPLKKGGCPLLGGIKMLWKTLWDINHPS